MTISAEKLDVEQLLELDSEMLATLREHGRAALGESALNEWLLPVIAGYGWLFVARCGGDFIGSAEVIRTRGDDEAYLEGIYITPAWQGRGLGRKLLREVMTRMEYAGFRRLWATLDPANEAGAGLYRSAGFDDGRLLRDHYGPGRDRLLLSAGLRSGRRG